MALSNQFSLGSEFVPAYQISGLPYIKRLYVTDFILPGGVAKITFPYVTSWVYIRSLSTNSSGTTKVSFIDGGISNGQYLAFDQGLLAKTTIENADPVLKIRCKEIYIYVEGSTNWLDSAYVEVLAGLTNIPSDNFQFDMNNLH